MTAELVRASIIRLIPTAELGLAPDNATLVNIQTITWINTSSNPGKPYNNTTDPCHAAQCPDYYGHTYRTPGTNTLTATATWNATFTIDGGQPITIPGTVTGPTAQTRVTVKQARAVLVPNPGH